MVTVRRLFAWLRGLPTRLRSACVALRQLLPDLADCCLLGGAVAVVNGCRLLHPALAWIVGGLILCTIGALPWLRILRRTS